MCLSLIAGAHVFVHSTFNVYVQVVYVLVCRVVLGYAIRTKGRANYKNPRTGQRTSQCVAMDPGE
jgi:hypothetical protein